MKFGILRSGALLVSLITGSFALVAQNAGKPAKNSVPSASTDELKRVRDILSSPHATYQDAFDLALIQRGEYEKFASAEARRERISELGIYPAAKKITDAETAPISRGAVSKIVLKMHDLDKGIMFSLTGAEMYAMKDLQALSIMPIKFAFMHRLSGTELIGVFDAALAEAEKKATWGQEENPYKAFGFSSYAEMEKGTAKRMEEEKSTQKSATAETTKGEKSAATAKVAEPAGAVTVQGGETAQVSGAGETSSPLQVAAQSESGQKANDSMTAAESTSVLQKNDVSVGSNSGDLQNVFNTVTEQTQPVAPTTTGKTPSELVKF